MEEPYYKKIYNQVMAKPTGIWFNIEKVPENEKFVAQVKEYIDCGEFWQISKDNKNIRRF